MKRIVGTVLHGRKGKEPRMSKLPGTTHAGTQSRIRTAIVTGASRGIGAGITRAFLDRGYNVVANALHFADSALAPNEKLALMEGNIGQASTAMSVAETAISRFGSIDAVVPNAGIFFTKPFTDYTPDDFRRLSETNLEGYLYITQAAQKTSRCPRPPSFWVAHRDALLPGGRHPDAASPSWRDSGGLAAEVTSRTPRGS
jgi:NAD(P)-dependent dehydrogenase (short-subunit alcohol dehydrogenase family)